MYTVIHKKEFDDLMEAYHKVCRERDALNLKLKAPDVFVVFDGPPGAESGRFVEVEDAQGKGLKKSASEWKQRSDGLWALGPFKSEGTEVY